MPAWLACSRQRRRADWHSHVSWGCAVRPAQTCANCQVAAAPLTSLEELCTQYCACQDARPVAEATCEGHQPTLGHRKEQEPTVSRHEQVHHGNC